MRSATWLTCLWPGLAPLWWQGRAGGLALAALFALLLNVALVVTFARPEWMGTAMRAALWCGLAVWWASSVSSSRRRLHSLLSPTPGPESDRLFSEAQEQYLQEHWFEAESLLRRLLDLDPKDVDAQLMLATLCRRTHRLDEAKKHLDRLEQMPRAAKWRLEIARERESLDPANASKEHGPEEDGEANSEEESPTHLSAQPNGKSDGPLAESPQPPLNAEKSNAGPADAGREVNNNSSLFASSTPPGRSTIPEPPADAAEAA